MTIGVAVESLVLLVNGGRLSPDDSVMRSDIRFFFPVAYNYAMEKTYNENLKIEFDRDFPSQYYNVFQGVPIERTENIPFIELILGTVPLKAGADIRFVYDNCGHFYAPVPDSELANIQYYSNIATELYWYRRTGNKLYLYGINPLIEEINYQSLTKIEDLTDDDELMLQAGQEETFFSFMSQWFKEKYPYSPIVNGQDVNSTET